MFSLSAAIDAVDEKFETYRAMLRAIAMGNVSHAIVWGAPGIGKSYELEQTFEKYSSAGRITWQSSSGHVTALSLYNMLYELRGSSDICVFDDCDHVFRDRAALNILKAATDTKARRLISWESSSGRPMSSRFEYTGRVVVLSNADFDKNPHMHALVDRMFFIPLQLNIIERVARIVSVLTRPEPGQELHPKADEVAAWIIANHERIGPKLTLRTAVKALQLASFSAKWEQMAEMSLGV